MWGSSERKDWCSVLMNIDKRQQGLSPLDLPRLGKFFCVVAFCFWSFSFVSFCAESQFWVHFNQIRTNTSRMYEPRQKYKYRVWVTNFSFQCGYAVVYILLVVGHLLYCAPVQANVHVSVSCVAASCRQHWGNGCSCFCKMNLWDFALSWQMGWV